MWAIVPLKSLGTAKSRLSSALTPPERKDLYLAMAQHVVETLQRTPGIERVIAVTSDEGIAQYVVRWRADVLREERDSGTAHACRLAVERLEPGSHSLLMIAGDLPLLSADVVARFTELGARSPLMAIAPDRHRAGTNALLCTPPHSVPICFGPDSFAMHLAAASQRNVPIESIDTETFALDIDTPDDLRRLRSLVEAGVAQVSSGIREFLAIANPEAERA